MAAVAAFIVWVASGPGNWWNLLYGFSLLTGILLLLRLSWSAGGDAKSAQVEVERLRRTDAAAARRLAVMEERDRLAADIEAAVHATVVRIGALVDDARQSWADNPIPQLRAIAAQGRTATHDLRRMLGLLRLPEPTVEPAPSVSTLDRRVRRSDIYLAAGAVLLAVVERWLYGMVREPGDPLSVICTAVAAGTVVLRRTRPMVGALACGAICAVSVPLSAVVLPGLWIILSCGCLAWAALASGRMLGLASFLGLFGGVTSTAIYQGAGNEGAVASIMLVAGAGGAIVGRSRWREGTEKAAANQIRTDLDQMRREAVAAERLEVARELHDLVSHAVSVMVMQAGAAEMTYRSNPEAAYRSLTVIAETAAAALAELDQLTATIKEGAIRGTESAAGAAERTESDLLAVIDRLRSAGMQITLESTGKLPSSMATVVHRIVQEALTNALRHGGAATAVVGVHCHPESVSVTVVDSGSGHSGRLSPGYGLIGLTERVGREHGQLRVGPGPGGRGFAVSATIPLIPTEEMLP